MVVKICYVTFFILLILVFLLTFRYKKNLTDTLQPKEHPLKSLYGTAFYLTDITGALQKKFFPHRRRNSRLRENLNRLHVGENIDALEYLAYGKRFAYAYLFLLLFSVLGLMYCFSSSSEPAAVTSIDRSSEEETYHLYVKTEEGETQNVDITVSAKEYDFKEALELFENYREDLIAEMLGENSDVETIQKPLNFITSMDNGTLKISWDVENENLIDYTGAIHPENIPEHGAATSVIATLTIGEHTTELTIPLILVP